MSTQAHTQAPAPATTNVNAGILAMRAANAARKLGLAPRTPTAAKPPRQVSARKPKPAPKADAPETPESNRDWRVCVLVWADEGESEQTHVWVGVSAAGPRRASGQARAEARRAGHSPCGVCAVLRDDAPSALLALAA